MIIGMAFVWLAVMVVLLIMEALTAGLTTIWFAGGALIAAIGAYFGISMINQLLLFVCVSLVLVILMRPLALKVMNKNVTQTNVNSVIGKRAIVTTEINNLTQSGRVKLGDIEWKASSLNEDEVIPKDAVVVIDKVAGVKLIVHKYGEEK